MSHPLLPPETIAGIDQATARAHERIDTLVAIYRQLLAQGHTESAACLALSHWMTAQLNEYDRQTVQGHLVDTVVVAISRLAHEAF